MVAASVTSAGEVLPYEQQIVSGVPRLKAVLRHWIAVATPRLAPVLRVATDQPAIALTFDDGPSASDTPRVLELLEEFGARGTFFVVGRSAAQNPELLERMRASGHALGNHTWDHPSLRALDRRERRQQLLRCREVLADEDVPLFRPPFGDLPLGALLEARRLRYEVVCWDVVADDWGAHDAGFVLGRILRRLRRGSIVVLHDHLFARSDDAHRDRGPMLAALEQLLARLRGHFRCVTVPELLSLGRPIRGPWFHRLSADFLRRQLYD